MCPPDPSLIDTVDANDYFKVRFVLSDQYMFKIGSNKRGSWPWGGFYRELTKMMEWMDEDDLNDLLFWWNEFVLTCCRRDPALIW
jgi:hypothetical protein